jgi:hypothetical protein
VTPNDDERDPATSPPRWVTVLIVFVVVLFVSMLVVLHLTGVVGPGAH